MLDQLCNLSPPSLIGTQLRSRPEAFWMKPGTNLHFSLEMRGFLSHLKWTSCFWQRLEVCSSLQSTDLIIFRGLQGPQNLVIPAPVEFGIHTESRNGTSADNACPLYCQHCLARASHGVKWEFSSAILGDAISETRDHLCSEHAPAMCYRGQLWAVGGSAHPTIELLISAQ